MTGQREKFTCQRIIDIQALTPKLFRLRCTRDSGFRFHAGQFVRLGVRKADESLVWRPYSMLSAPTDEFLEFFSVVVPQGEFTQCLARLRSGDPLWVEKQPYGFLTLDRFPDGHDLWLLATGTGIAPFLSILQEDEPWQRFAHIRLIYSARHRSELAYLDRIDALAEKACGDGQWGFLPVLTGESVPGTLQGRITALLASGALEAAAGLALDAERSRIMLCGNPQMVEDMMPLLKARGMRLSLSRTPGQLAAENYW